MLKEWQFNVLFFVGVGGAILLLLGPEAGIHVSQNPTAVTGVGAILTYVLTQKKALTKDSKKEKTDEDSESTKESSYELDQVYSPVEERRESEYRLRSRSEQSSKKGDSENEEEAR